MKIVVAGGTGLIGTSLVRALSARGDAVTVLSRRRSPSRAGETIIAWDAGGSTGRPDWYDAVDGADAVVNLAGAGIADAKWTPERLSLLLRSRVDSTVALARAIAAARDKPRTMLSGSAIGYYGAHPDGPTFDESSPAGTDVLGQMCVAWEAAAALAKESGLRVAHPRMGVVLSKDGGALPKFLGSFNAFAGGPIGSGHQVLSWVSAPDCIRALLFALDAIELSGPFNVCSPNPVDMDVFAKTLGKVLHRPATVRVPSFALRLAMGEMANVVLLGQRVMPRRLLALGFGFEDPTLEQALRRVLTV